MITNDKLIELGKKVGSINGKEVWKADSGSETIYFLVTDGVVHVLIGFSDGYFSNVVNITKKPISVRELLGYIVHVEKQKVRILADARLTHDGLKWLIYLIKRPSGLRISDQQGNSVDPNELYKEWERARQTGNTGPTGIVMTEDKDFGDSIRENERRRQPDSLLLPFILYDNDDYIEEK